jgi:Signal transduction histidine kinase involved in nitrogen fixation and metabolism regulation
MSYGFWGQGPKFIQFLKPFLSSSSVRRWLVIALILAALLCGFATYYVFSTAQLEDFGSTQLILLLNLDLIVLLLLALIIFRRLAKLWAARKTGQAAAKLHSRFVLLFSLLAITPAILMTIFSAMMFNMGLQAWFSDRVKIALEESTKVAEAYLDEHKKVISASVYNMARDLASEYQELAQNPEMFNRAIDIHAKARNLDEALVFQNTAYELEVVARSKLSFALEFEGLYLSEIEKAQNEVVIKTNPKGDRVRALTRISPTIDAYLLVGLIIDPAVSKRIAEVKDAVSNYHELENEQTQVQLYFTLMFLAVALLLLMIAVWVALSFAGKIAKPIGDLINASERIRQGDLSTRVVPSEDEDEIGLLMRSFNRMTEQLDEQRSKLIHAYHEIDQRRKFIEDVLAGVTHGVISIDSGGKIQVINIAACILLGVEETTATAKSINTIFPECYDLLAQLTPAHPEQVSAQIRVPRKGIMQTLFVRIMPEVNEHGSAFDGFIITFADVTELVAAQRKAAWADVARRIAHEIRNPLTPIQLSAERLNRKYLKQIKEDPEKFESCVDTIIRQVTHIGDMVKEFSNFARMPEPKMNSEDLLKLIRQHVEQYKNANPDITFTFATGTLKTLPFLCDAAQISQVLTNLLLNAVESLQEDQTKEPKITVAVEMRETSFTVLIQDNGPGFPKENRDRLTEPYETRKEKGTGLGLAIVKKIIEDHGGTLSLEDSPKRGAIIRLTFNRIQ